MTHPDRERLESLFHKAMDFDAERRTQFVADLTRKEPQLGKALENLLDRYSNADRVFENLLPALAEMLDEDPDESETGEDLLNLRSLDSGSGEDGREDGVENGQTQTFHAGRPANGDVPVCPPPEKIGRYTLRGKVGEGGMGAVYLARQEHTDRDVALKIISRHRMSPEFRTRFESEYHVQSLMKHTHIAQIYEAGDTGDGSTYFTMEYVDGPAITTYAQEHNLSIEERLHLFLQVCEGVLHAHQKAVIHRDLKPSNILVTVENEEPVAKIIDFGIAKGLEKPLTEQPFQTLTGALIGTPDHMSPEQLSTGCRETDTRTDIYALGVVLYELLADCLPIDARQLKNAPLDEVLRFYREEEPPRPSMRVRNRNLSPDLDWIVMKAMAKDADRRYPTVADLKGDLLCFLDDRPVSARPPGLPYRIRKFVRRNKILVSATALVLLALFAGFAIASWSFLQVWRAQKHTEAAYRKMQAINEFLEQMLSAPNPHDLGIDTKVIDILEEAETSLTRNFQGDEELKASISTTLGNTYWGLSSYDEATHHLGAALAIRQRLKGERHPDTARIHYFLARALWRREAFPSAEDHLQRALAVQQTTLGPDHRHTLQSLAGRAIVLRLRKQYAPAGELFRQVLDRQLLFLGERDPDTVQSMVGLANSYLGSGRLEEAETWYRKALPIQEEINDLTNPSTLATRNSLAICLKNLGRFSQSEKLFRETIKLREQVLGEDHALTLSSLYSLALCLYAQNKEKKAEPIMHKVFDRRRTSLGPNALGTLRAMDLLAKIQAELGYLDEAIGLNREMLDLLYQNGLGDTRLAAGIMNGLGYCLVRNNAHSQAVPVLQHSLAIKMRALGEQDAATHTTLDTLAGAFRGLAQHERALFFYCRVWDLSLTYQPDNQLTPLYQARYADCLTDFKRFPEAETLLLDSYHQLQDAAGAPLGEVSRFLARLYLAWGKPARAAPYERALNLHH